MEGIYGNEDLDSSSWLYLLQSMYFIGSWRTSQENWNFVRATFSKPKPSFLK